MTLYLTAEDVDRVVAKAIKLGAALQGPVIDMLRGDRCGTLIDPDGYLWMVETHLAANVSVKLSSSPGLSREPYPFRDVAVHLKRVFDAYGPQRSYACKLEGWQADSLPGSSGTGCQCAPRRS